VIARLYGRAIAHKPCTLTHDDVKELLVRPEHYQAVEDARELFGNSSGEYAEVKVDDPFAKGNSSLVQVQLRVSRDNPGFPFPTYVGREVYGDPEGPARKALATWVKWRAKVGRDWCLANNVFSELNRRCSTPAQVRYFWPSIVGLLALSDDEKVRAKADKLRAYKAPSGIPPVEKAFVEACKSASAIIAKGLLYPEVEGTPEAMSGPVVLGLPSFVTPERPWDPGRHCSWIYPA
jgi:hypothetical protein